MTNMHTNNHSWLKDLQAKYPDSFNGVKVLDLGSLDVNGSCKQYFNNCKYVGVDLEDGKNVDIVSKNTETKFRKNQFDTLISFNCFEHDFDWKDSIVHNMKWLKSGGMFFAEFGAEGCPVHNYPVFRAVPHQEFVDFLADNGFEVVEHFWENHVYSPSGGMPGIYCVVAKKL